jgi:hypothetical protein
MDRVIEKLVSDLKEDSDKTKALAELIVVINDLIENSEDE